MLKNVLDNKEDFVRKSSSLLCTHRFCIEENSNIFVCAGGATQSDKYVRNVTLIDGNQLSNVKNLSSMKKDRRFAEAVFLLGNVYVFRGCYYNGNTLKSIEKYSVLRNRWYKVTDMYDGRNDYCICSFMDKIYIIGGRYKRFNLDSALEFDPGCTNNNKWKELASMNRGRQYAACAVFEGIIVVSGGKDNLHNTLKTVEAYDVIGNEWSPMADMVNDWRTFNSLLVIIIIIINININKYFN